MGNLACFGENLWETWPVLGRNLQETVLRNLGLFRWKLSVRANWRRRVAVEIGRGRVNCLGRSADPGYKGDSGSSAETAPYALR